MRSSLISSFLINHQHHQHHQKNSSGSYNKNDSVTVKEDDSSTKILKDKKVDGREALLEKYQPDLVRDVPVNAIGSPETPSQCHKQRTVHDKGDDIVYDKDNDDDENVLNTSDDYDHVEFVELEDKLEDEETTVNVEYEDENALLLNTATKKKTPINKKKINQITSGSDTANFQSNEHSSDDNSNTNDKTPPLPSDIKCFSLLKDLLYSVVTKPMTLGRFYSRKAMSSKAGMKSHCSLSDSDDSSWEIKMEEIDEMHWIGSGAQGAVFLGRWRNEEVAIKKVRTERDTDIKHLRNLDHKNIVKFR